MLSIGFDAMITLAKRRREQERMKKLEEAFRETDINQTGTINAQQLVKCFAAHEVTGRSARQAISASNCGRLELTTWPSCHGESRSGI